MLHARARLRESCAVTDLLRRPDQIESNLLSSQRQFTARRRPSVELGRPTQVRQSLSQCLNDHVRFPRTIRLRGRRHCDLRRRLAHHYGRRALVPCAHAMARVRVWECPECRRAERRTLGCGACGQRLRGTSRPHGCSGEYRAALAPPTAGVASRSRQRRP